jgi:hypothetical protein
LRVEFGLGRAEKIDTVRIEWPSGTVQELHDINPRQILTVTEPSKLISPSRTTNDSFQFTLIGAVNVPFLLESSSNLVDWARLLTITNKTRSELLIDTNSPVGTRFYRAFGPETIAFPQ